MKFSKILGVMAMSSLLLGAFAAAAQEMTPEATEEAPAERVPYCTPEIREELAAQELYIPVIS